MQSTVGTFAIKPALIAALGLLMLGVFAQPAFASVTNLQSATFLEWQTGQLDSMDKRDGYWFFVSGKNSSLRVDAQSTNGRTIGAMSVWSNTRQAWLLAATATSTTHTFTANVGSGWHYVQLQNFDNTTTTYRLGITARDQSTDPDGGNSYNAATLLRGVGVNGTSWQDEVGLGDTTDIFRVELPAGSNFLTIHAFDTWSGGATVQLVDAKQNVLQTATVNGTKAALIQRSVAGGSYFIRVEQAGNQSLKGTRYHLWVRSEQTQPDYAGDLDNPRYMGGVRVGRTHTADDYVVARIDQIDAYSFDVSPINGANTQQYFNVSIRGNAGDANLYLLDANKNIIANSTSAGSNETISRYLRPGRYQLMVLSTGTEGISYRLAIYNQGPPYTPPVVVTDKGSNTRQTVTLLGMANAQGLTISDDIGGTDVADWWRITVPGPNVFTRNAIVGFVMQVTGLPAGAVVQMYSPTSSTPTVSVPASGGTAQFTTSLSPGPWDVVVLVPSGTAATTYKLSACSYSTYLGCTLP